MGSSERLPAGTADALRGAVDAGMSGYVQTLARLVAVPGIAWPSFDPAHLDESALEVSRLLKDLGFSDVEIVRAPADGGTTGAPAVIATRPARPGFPTVLLYAHHDVQPPGDPEEWTSDPFSLTERDGRLWGRGAADDKGGLLMHLAAVDALDRVLGPAAGVGLTLFIEGEEECGSPTLPALLDLLGPRMAANVAVVADSGSWAVGTPALTTSLRGLVDGVIEVRPLEHALHSGSYGGPVLDALTLLGRLMATFHHPDGSVAVQGLPSAEVDGVDVPEADFRRDAGVLDGVELAGHGRIASRLWTKPALSFIGVDAPAIEVASNTLLPSAAVKFSLRVPPGTDPDAAMEAVRQHVLANVPFGADVTFTPGTKSMPFAVDSDSPVVETALWSLEEAWGAPPVSMGVGGSIPFVAALSGRFPECQILITGAEDPDSRAHGADESVHLGELRNAILAEALFLAAVNSGPRAPEFEM